MPPLWPRTLWAGTKRTDSEYKTDRLAYTDLLQPHLGKRENFTNTSRRTKRSETAQNFISLFIISSQDICHISRIFFPVKFLTGQFFFFFFQPTLRLLHDTPSYSLNLTSCVCLSIFFYLSFYYFSFLEYSPLCLNLPSSFPNGPVNNCDKLNENETLIPATLLPLGNSIIYLVPYVPFAYL